MTGGAHTGSAPNNRAPRPSLFDPTLYTLAQYLDDVEGLRKAQANRARILTATEPDEDGVVRGFGYDETHPVVAVVTAQLEQLAGLEHAAILELQRVMRRHPLNAWRKTAKGVGEKQLARLLAAVGDPYLRADTGQPRTVSQLWAYCGLHTLPGDGGNEAARRRKGQQANWSTDAKTRAYLIAMSCVKQTGSEYRAVYDARRAHTATTRPDWTPGHSHNDALRIVSKRVLRDLWRAARDHYKEGNNHDEQD
ncbi:hypothetical protein [Collinsella sp. Sow4_E3]|uniref:hypothetical protein n=1 Tax=Collinsella sp. Sow4_E3 TaxID=3438776 RepID=UPI003F8F9269